MWEQAWEQTKDAARHEWKRMNAEIPPDIQRILNETPATETPVLPIRADTLVFIDRDYPTRYQLNRNVEYFPSSVGGRDVHFKVTDTIRDYLDAIRAVLEERSDDRYD